MESSQQGALCISKEAVRFLEAKGVPYFFTNYSDNNIVENKSRNNIEIQYLYDQINFEKYLPVTSEHRWCYENSKFTDLWSSGWEKQVWLHPHSKMHKEFVDQVIYPWIKEKYVGFV